MTKQQKPKYLLIGLCGKMNSGKDTIANYLATEYFFKKYHLAEPLKKGLMILFDLSIEQITDRNSKEKIDTRWNVSPRTLMQRFGTELFQEKIYELFPELIEKIPKQQFWIKRFEEQFKEDLEHDNTLNSLTHDVPFRYVIADIRFIHEAIRIKQLGGFIIKIIRPKQINEKIDKHLSEIEVDKIEEDFLINNNETIKELLLKIDEIILKLK